MNITGDFIEEVAKKNGAKWPELVVAQWILESGRGKYTSGKFNYFGLKGKGSNVLTHEYINGKRVNVVDGFINFESPEECVSYLIDRWYKDWNGYYGVNRASSKEEAARMLVSEGYATDPNYSNKLIAIMSEKQDYADLVDAAEYFEGTDQQIKAFKDLQASLTDSQKQKFTDTWRARPQSGKTSFPLSVPYFYQSDSKTGQGQRMCQSSSIAMRLEQIDPKIIGDDDSYLQIVNRYGDSVSQSAHKKALDSLGLKNEFRQDGNEKLLCDLLDQGIAVPIGVLHKGPVSAPTGGGHWIVLIGYDDTFFYVHDPYGEMDLTNGGYTKTGPLDGKNQKYTRKNLMKRWLIQSKSDGWLWIIRR